MYSDYNATGSFIYPINSGSNFRFIVNCLITSRYYLTILPIVYKYTSYSNYTISSRFQNSSVFVSRTITQESKAYLNLS